ncbi:MAG: recombinase family protein [Candidatus Latescibacterota bacterium]
MALRTAIYMRVSTQDQSVESQRHELRRFIEARDGLVLVGEYEDIISGVTANMKKSPKSTIPSPLKSGPLLPGRTDRPGSLSSPCSVRRQYVVDGDLCVGAQGLEREVGQQTTFISRCGCGGAQQSATELDRAFVGNQGQKQRKPPAESSHLLPQQEQLPRLHPFPCREPVEVHA